jgi:transcriptional regulator with XRE-family HTH domain
MADIGRRIKELREERNLTQEDLARRLNTHPHSIWRYEAGTRSLTAEKIEDIARVLGVEPGELFPKAGTPTRYPTTYLELLEVAGAEDSGLERPVEQEAPGNISELFEGLRYIEAYELYRSLATKREAVRRVAKSFLSRDLDPAVEQKIRNLDALAYERMLVAFGNVYAALEKAKANTEIPDEVGEIEELQNRLVGTVG